MSTASVCGCVRVPAEPFLPHVAVRAARSFRPKVLPPQHRLRRSEDFRSVIRKGNRAGGRYVVLHVLTESTRPSRVGFVVSKAIGNAVTRNRVKRRMRHAVHVLIEELAHPVKIVVRALPRSSEASFSELLREIRHGLGKIGVLQ